METTFTFFRRHTPQAVMFLLAVLYLQFSLGGDIDELRDELRTEMSGLRFEMT